MTEKNTVNDGEEGILDMRPYLTVYKDDELDGELDEIADGPGNDYEADGSLDKYDDPVDTSDKWWVTFDVPDELGNYGAKIWIEIPERQ